MSVTTTDAADAPAAAVRDAAGDAADAEHTLLAWRVYRLREEPRGIPLVAGAYAAAFLLWWIVFPQPLALFLPLVALTGALSDYLFPISYRLTTRGAYADCGASRLFLAWTDVKRATTGADGVFLSPLARASRLDAWRGVRLRFSSGNDAEVRDTARALWKGAAAGSQTGAAA
jgi:hypothetical protein